MQIQLMAIMTLTWPRLRGCGIPLMSISIMSSLILSSVALVLQWSPHDTYYQVYKVLIRTWLMTSSLTVSLCKWPNNPSILL